MLPLRRMLRRPEALPAVVAGQMPVRPHRRVALDRVSLDRVALHKVWVPRVVLRKVPMPKVLMPRAVLLMGALIRAAVEPQPIRMGLW